MLENSEDILKQVPLTQVPKESQNTQTSQNTVTGIKSRLTLIVNCLIDYKKKFITKTTLRTPVSADLNNVIRDLKERCNRIKAFMIPPRIRPPRSNDEDFEACLDCLAEALKPWDSDLSILCPEFCDKIFEDFNHNSQKILDEIDLYCPVDGVSDDEASQI